MDIHLPPSDHESILGYQVTTIPRNEFTDKLKEELHTHHNRRVFTLNPHSYCVSLVDKDFSNALHEAEFIIPDGTGMVLASIFLGGHITKRLTGPDVLIELSQKLNSKKGVKYAFFGSSQVVLDKISHRMAKDYPNIEVSKTISPPFRKISEEENQKFCQEINDSGADILWVGMTAPKQEKWIHENLELLNVKLIVPIGAAFDFYAGTVKRPKLIWRRLGLEWLPRFCKDPVRLWKRNFISTPLFLFLLLKSKLLNKIKKKRGH